MSGHAFLAPSSAARWVMCAGSPLLESMYPESDEDPSAKEGTAAHWAGSESLFGRERVAGEIAPNGIVLTDEIIEGAEEYVSAIDRRLARLGVTREVLHVEEHVTIPAIDPQNHGTPDAWFYVPQHATLDVFDFKFGHGVVDVFENWQLIDYACGILDSIGIDGFSDQTLTVHFHIVQPRAYHSDGAVRSWSIRAADLRPYFNRLRNAAEAAMQMGARCTPHPECVHCRGRHVCEALQRDAYRSVQLSSGSLPVELSPAALGLELMFLRAASKRLAARITGLEEQARATLMSGELVPFHAMENAAGREEWVKPIDEVLQLGALFGVNVAKRGVITPLQAIDAGLPADVVRAGYTDKKRTLKLVQDDGSKARKVFGAK